MAAQGITPFIKVEDSNGNPIIGAKLYVYEAGTTTLRDIYADADLSVALSNPLKGVNGSDASGKFPRFYMAAGSYKLKATTITDSELWTYDNIDTGLSAGLGALPISGGGTGATTPAAARVNLDVPSNSEMAALSSTISGLTTAIQNIVSAPQGYLTLTSGVPVIASDVVSATSVYYTPLTGNIAPVYDGSQFNPKVFDDIALALSSSHVANNLYDVFIINDGGTIRLVTGPAWTTSTAGLGARGAGGGTTELVRTNGVWTNKYAMATARNGATTYNVAASCGTYVGTIFIDGSAGQITCHRSYGQSRKWGVWNAYNRVQLYLQAGDPTSSWNYTTAAYRPSNNNSANSLTVFVGLAEECVQTDFFQKQTISATTSPIEAVSTIGWNSTSAAVGTFGDSAFSVGSGASGIAANLTATANYVTVPAIGIHTVTSLEYGATTTTFSGTQAYMKLLSQWRG